MSTKEPWTWILDLVQGHPNPILSNNNEDLLTRLHLSPSSACLSSIVPSPRQPSLRSVRDLSSHCCLRLALSLTFELLTRFSQVATM